MKDESEIRNEKIYEKVMNKYLRENNASIHTTREVAILCMEEVEQKPTDEPKQVYHLNCDNCGNVYWSINSFPKPQWCEKCVKEYFSINP